MKKTTAVRIIIVLIFEMFLAILCTSVSVTEGASAGFGTFSFVNCVLAILAFLSYDHDNRDDEPGDHMP